jgi:adenylate cyclase class 2
MALEVEIKLSVKTSVPLARKALRDLGYGIRKRRVFESNQIFDLADRRLRQSRELIRLRRVGHLSILTYKGPPQAAKHKSREEIETEISEPENLEIILSKLGLSPSFKYEKYRTEYHKEPEAGIVTLDETPIGNFFELEGPPRWIDRTARQLGYKSTDYMTQSYATLYFSYCQEHGIQPGNMVFDKSHS